MQVCSVRTTSPVGNLKDGAALLPTGQVITPAAAPGSTFERLATGVRKDGNADAAEAVTTALSPDGKTLLVLTSGYNQNFKKETEPEADITIPTTGTYTLGLGVSNVTDTVGNLGLLVDSVRLEAVPEPSSVLGILALAVGTACSRLLRKHKVAS